VVTLICLSPLVRERDEEAPRLGMCGLLRPLDALERR